MKIYIAGKYGAHSLPVKQRLANVNKAIEIGRELIRMGHCPFIPHLSHYIHEGWANQVDSNAWYAIDIIWLQCCDAILMLDNWEDSQGAKLEHELAIRLHLPIYYSLGELPSGHC
jgi:hypothetical protein